MFYTFPKITNIAEVLPAIAGRDEFVVKHDEKNGLKFINYNVNFEDTFPPVKTELDAIRRECRGIAFYADTGEIASRPFHKFFNLNERPETMVTAIDWSVVYDTLDKIDGSFIRPILLRSDEHLWGTKMGDTPVAEKTANFIDSMPQMSDFAYEYTRKNMTPIFEFTSRSQRIVIDYGPEDMMRLIGLRNNVTGVYHTYMELLEAAERFNVYVVGKLSGKRTIVDLMAHTKDLVGEEGYVLSFVNGHKVKLKAEHYCLLHKTIDHLRFEKDVLRLILDNKIDDAKPFLSEEMRDVVHRFEVKIESGLRKTASDVYWMAAEAYDNLNGSRKKFAEFVNSDASRSKLSKFLFRAFSYLEEGEKDIEALIFEDVVKSILQVCGTQSKVDANRHLFGNANWYEVAGEIPEE